MRRFSRLSLVLLSVTIIATLHAGTGGAVATESTLYVRTSGSDASACTSTAPCRTITHAVAVAASGDTIDVGAGAFSEGTGVVIDKNLTIKGLVWAVTKVTTYWGG
jgi:hypothetical protein